MKFWIIRQCFLMALYHHSIDTLLNLTSLFPYAATTIKSESWMRRSLWHQYTRSLVTGRLTVWSAGQPVLAAQSALQSLPCGAVSPADCRRPLSPLGRVYPPCRTAALRPGRWFSIKKAMAMHIKTVGGGPREVCNPPMEYPGKYLLGIPLILWPHFEL